MLSINIDLEPQICIELEQVVSQTGDLPNEIISKALEKYFLELREDAEDIKDAESAWEEFLSSGENAIPAGKVYKDLGL